MQFHVGHVALNFYLHRIKKAKSPRCQQCGASCETVHHYLFECQAWKQERWMLGKALRRKATSLQHILSSPEGVEELLRYVGWTECLKAMLGAKLSLI